MESNRKRRGFIKGKINMPFYRSAKSNSNLQYSSKVIKPSQSSPSTASVGFVVHHHQDYIIAPPKQQKLSFIVPATDNNRDKLAQFDKIYGVAVDESVDIKTASYISSVQERFKLERSNSERVKNEEVK